MPSAVTQSPAGAGSRYKWIALSNTTLGMLMATVNSSIMLIALPDIFRGIGVDPLQPGNTTLLLWLLYSPGARAQLIGASFADLWSAELPERDRPSYFVMAGSLPSTTLLPRTK